MTDANNQINDVLSKLTALGTVLIPMNLVTGKLNPWSEMHINYYGRSLGDERSRSRGKCSRKSISVFALYIA